MAEWAWMVSFTINENGSLGEYHMEQIDLSLYRFDTVEKLRSQTGQGLFETAEEAEEWAKMQTGRNSCGCNCSKGGKGCGCSHT